MAGAALLYSKLEGVNALLEQIGQQPFSSLTSSGTWPSKTYTSDICSQVERVLDRHTISVLQQGNFDFNTVGPVNVTPAAGVIRFSTNSAFGDFKVLRVIPEGTSKREPMVVVGDYLYNPKNGLANSASAWTASSYCMTLVVAYEFNECPVDAQILIRDSAIKELTETRLGDQLRVMYAKENAAKADIQAQRSWTINGQKPLNQSPIIPNLPNPGGG